MAASVLAAVILPALYVAPVAAQAETLSASRVERIDAGLQRYADDNRVAGAVALVLRDGAVVYERAFGWSDREAGTRMTPGTLFRIASQTKALTSVAILMLMEEGRVSLDDPVARYIPTFARTTVAVASGDTMNVVPARRAITIRDLLTHTAGISYGTASFISQRYVQEGLGPAAGYGWYTADRNDVVCATMERLGTLPFVAQPGEAWVYGYSTDVLGCVVERASGMTLDEFFRVRITDPLGMHDTHFFIDPAERARLAAVYATDSAGFIVRAPDGARGQGHYIDGPRRNLSGGAGLVSTAHDYARFLEMIRNGGSLGGVRILAPRTVELMTTNQVGDRYPLDGLGWSLAFETIERYGASGAGAVGSYGWGGAYGSWYRVDPAAGMVMVFMMQLMPNGTDIRQKFPTLVYQALTDDAEAHSTGSRSATVTAADTIALPAPGRRSVSFTLPDGGGAEFGIWKMRSAHQNRGLFVRLNASVSEGESRSGASLSSRMAALSVGPVFRRYIGFEHGVAPFVQTSLSIGGQYAWGEQVSGDILHEQSQWGLTAGTALGLGAEWFPHRSASIAGATGLSLTGQYNDVGNGGSQWSVNLRTFTSTIALHIYF